MVVVSFILIQPSFNSIYGQKKKFSVTTHDNTNFPLTGKHRSVPCSDCHLKGVLQNTAVDMAEPGYDPATGAGFILADSALLSLANPPPFISGIFYDTTLTPGFDEIWITVYGEYLNEESTIWFNGELTFRGRRCGSCARIARTAYARSRFRPAPSTGVIGWYRRMAVCLQRGCWRSTRR